MRYSHYNEVYGVFLQEAMWHTLPVKVIVLYIKDFLACPSLIVELNDLFVAHLPIIGDDKHILMGIAGKGVRLPCFVWYPVSYDTMRCITKLIGQGCGCISWWPMLQSCHCSGTVPK